MTTEIYSLNLYGARKTGKTTFALSCPTPLGVFDFEDGVTVVERHYIPDPDGITVVPIAEPLLNLPRKAKPKTAKQVWGEFLTAYNKYLEDSTTKTIVFDTFTAVWELCRNAYLAELQEGSPGRTQLLQVEYTEPNRRMKNLVVQGRLHKKLIVLVHHARNKYVMNSQGESVQSNELEPDGFKASGDLADVVLYFTKGMVKVGDTTKKMPVVEIQDCRQCMAAEGLVLPTPNYETLFNLIKSLRGE